MPEKTCLECFYYDGFKVAKVDQGLCRRYPPVTSPHFPVVHEHNPVCGEFKQKGKK